MKGRETEELNLWKGKYNEWLYYFLVSYLMVCPKHSIYANLVRIFPNTQAELLLDTLNGTDWAERVLLRGWPDAGQ